MYVCISLLVILVTLMLDVVIILTLDTVEVGLVLGIEKVMSALDIDVVSLTPGGVVIITTPVSPLPIELVATTENV